MRGQVWMIRSQPPQMHTLAADLTEHRERPPDLGDAGLGLFLLAQGRRGHQRQEKTLMLDEQVVELPDELPGQLLLLGLLGDDRLPRSAEFVDEAGEGQDEGLAKQ